MIIFHQYGARRSGTNYIQALLEENFSNILVMGSLFWKHDYCVCSDDYKRLIFPNYPNLSTLNPDGYKKEFKDFKPWRNDDRSTYTRDLFNILSEAALSNNIKTLITVKNPYAWIESLQRWTLGNHEEPNEALYMFYETESKEMVINEGHYFFNHEQNTRKHIESYNKRHKQWLTQADEVIMYEAALQDYEKLLIYFENKYNLQRRHDELVNISSGCDPFPIVIQGETENWSYKDYYLEKTYFQNLLPETLKIITETIDWDLFQEYGYEPI